MCTTATARARSTARSRGAASRQNRTSRTSFSIQPCRSCGYEGFAESATQPAGPERCERALSWPFVAQRGRRADCLARSQTTEVDPPIEPRCSTSRLAEMGGARCCSGSCATRRWWRGCEPASAAARACCRGRSTNPRPGRGGPSAIEKTCRSC